MVGLWSVFDARRSWLTPFVLLIGGFALLGNAASTWSADTPAARIMKFSLPDSTGKLHTPKEWRDQEAVVLYFIGTECPVSNGYSPDMQAIAKKYGPRGVVRYGVHVDPSVSAEVPAAHAKDYGLAFPILLDHEQKLAQMAGARVTPDAIVVTPDGTVRYRGRIDNRYALDGKRRDVPTKHELVDALEAVLAGKQPAVAETKAFGCPLPLLRSSR
mgnify:FL=1